MFKWGQTGPLPRGRRSCARESPRLFFKQANGYTTRRHEAARPRMNRRAVFAFWVHLKHARVARHSFTRWANLPLLTLPGQPPARPVFFWGYRPHSLRSMPAPVRRNVDAPGAAPGTGEAGGEGEREGHKHHGRATSVETAGGGASIRSSILCKVGGITPS